MNICSVSTDVWQRSRIKLDASSRHSDGYFLDVNSKNYLGLISITERALTNPSRQGYHFMEFLNLVSTKISIKAHPIKQKLSKKPRSTVTNYE